MTAPLSYVLRLGLNGSKPRSFPPYHTFREHSIIDGAMRSKTLPENGTKYETKYVYIHDKLSCKYTISFWTYQVRTG